MSLSAWFVKRAGGIGRSQRRFFVLRDQTISYYAKEVGGQGVDLKGTIELNSMCLVGAVDAVLAIDIGTRTFSLEAPGGTAQAEMWRSEIAAVVASGATAPASAAAEAGTPEPPRARTSSRSLPFIPGASDGTTPTRPRASSRTLPQPPPSPSGPQLSGWFTKDSGGRVAKRQRRFFELRTGSIFYYASALAGKGTQQKGMIEIGKHTNVTHDSRGTLIVANPDRIWTLVADPDPAAGVRAAPAQAEAWCARIGAEIARPSSVSPEKPSSPLGAAAAAARAASIAMKASVSSAGVPTAIAVESTDIDAASAVGNNTANSGEALGWFTKKGDGALKGDKRRWFELEGKRALYYISVTDGHGHDLKGMPPNKKRAWQPFHSVSVADHSHSSV